MSNQEQHKGTTYTFATIGARTECGGYMTSATSGTPIHGLNISRVGDIVTHHDGIEAVIIDEASSMFVSKGKRNVPVGRHLSNGDRIVFTPRDYVKSCLFVEDSSSPEGLFDPQYVPLSHEPGYSFAVHDATIARQGVFLEPHGEWHVDGEAIKVSLIGDAVQYSDGTTARVTDGPQRRDKAWPDTLSIGRRAVTVHEGGAA